MPGQISVGDLGQNYSGGNTVELTATRLTELDLPLDWIEQHELLAS